MSLFELVGVIVGSITGSSVLTSWITARALKKKTNADAADDVANSAKLLVETMRIDLMALKQEVKDYRLENLNLQKRVYELEAELKVYKTFGAGNAPVATTHP